jgi:hypothetical protein
MDCQEVKNTNQAGGSSSMFSRFRFEALVAQASVRRLELGGMPLLPLPVSPFKIPGAKLARPAFDITAGRLSKVVLFNKLHILSLEHSQRQSHRAPPPCFWWCSFTRPQFETFGAATSLFILVT